MVIDCIDLWRFACLCELLHRTYIVSSYCCIVNIAGTCCTHVRMILSMASLQFVECGFISDSGVIVESAPRILSGFVCCLVLCASD